MSLSSQTSTSIQSEESKVDDFDLPSNYQLTESRLNQHLDEMRRLKESTNIVASSTTGLT
jgi:hypothetical protein